MENNNIKVIKLRGAVAIKILAIFSLVMTMIEGFDMWSYYAGAFFSGTVFRYLTLPYIFGSLIPAVLFVLYILVFHKKRKAAWIMPAIIGSNLALYAYCYFEFEERREGFFGFLLLLTIIALIVALISSFDGLTKKVPVIVGMAVCLVYEVAFVIYIYIDYDDHFHDFMDFVYYIAPLMLFVAIIIFTAKNRTPAIARSVAKIADKVANVSPEKALVILRDSFENDEITEEEYNNLRAKVIAKL